MDSAFAGTVILLASPYFPRVRVSATTDGFRRLRSFIGKIFALSPRVATLITPLPIRFWIFKEARADFEASYPRLLAISKSRSRLCVLSSGEFRTFDNVFRQSAVQ
jgi:hypothetical protein